MLSFEELKKNSGLTTWEMWIIHEKIINKLEEKGYGTVNIKLRPCEYGTYEAIELDWQVASLLQGNIQELGYKTILERDPYKKSLSWIVFPYNLITELQDKINNLKNK